ncbi:amidase [Agromyces sp. Root1464]|uniref:amidase n=1 Tax=Agromyces sp. Root1464 TaxID=1736467 RepID=UPI0006F61FD5|nr:amidase [Agromyces sp. Root1464]KQZ08176.1 amidase [Agromyces sp. Root1464]
MSPVNVVEASIRDLAAALADGRTTAVELLDTYLERIQQYDAAGTPVALNAYVVMSSRARAEAVESDERRARGATLGILDGIPYSAKNSYLAKGLTAAAGSPAFTELVAQHDAFTIERLRAAGAVLIGLTNMPPMANGGMQRGAYGRAESPYNAEWLTSAFGSGSSNGSGSATAASLCAFGLGEETWSSGRAPASNNALCAYTPSRGLISMRGNWPLTPTMDVVVPHTRTMDDLLVLLDTIVHPDHRTRGDFWREQHWLDIPDVLAHRPESYTQVASSTVKAANTVLRGKRFGVPRMYINRDPDAGTGIPGGIGGPTGQRIDTRASIIELWEAARRDLEAAGATVVEVDFPLVSNYEGDRAGAPTIKSRGLVSTDYLQAELVDLAAWSWEDFLNANGDPELCTLAQIDGDMIFPDPPGALPDRYEGFEDGVEQFPAVIAANPRTHFTEIPFLAEGIAGLEETRRRDLDEWIDQHDLDAVVFPAVADLGPADMDVNPSSADAGWRNGVWVANGNIAIRHFGIPTVTVPMGVMRDTRMPVGLTFAGVPYSDVSLLRFASAFERTGKRRVPPARTP